MAQKVITLNGTVELPQVPFNQTQELLVMASLQAPLYEQNPDDKRAPVDICCVIDKSGSMAGAKLELAKEALHFVVKNLEATDTLSVVVYDTEVTTLFDFVAMDKAGKATAEDRINRIAPGSSTNLCGGLVRGLELQGARKNPHDISSVLILTDGLANHGITETPAITAEMEKLLGAAAKRSTVFTFGFGADHNQEMLRSIAEAGGGMYYFVENADHIPKSFADCLGGLQSIVAQNILLAVEGLDGTRLLKSLNSKFKLTQGSLPGNHIQLEVGDIYSEEERDLVFLVELPQLPAARPEVSPIVSFKLTYFNVLSSEDHSAEEFVSIARPASVSDNLRANVALDKQRNRLEAADAMEKARRLANEGQLAQAQDLIRERKDKILKSESANETFCEKLVKELDQCIDDMKSREHYRLEGAKKMARKEQAHQYQRSNRIVDSEEDFYETSSKMHMKSGFH